MNLSVTAAFGWLVPGGAYLLARRYLQFAVTLALVGCATAAGMALHGANLWPQAGELQGLDGFTAGMAQAGALARVLAGGPYLLARLCDYSRTFLSGQTHEFGTTLLVLAGLFNLLALADGLQLRKAKQA
jgi:hypothetical protein